jgi:protein ImuB
MLWACLHFSDLPLHAVFDVDERRQRCALVDGPRQRQHVVFASAEAAQCGVRADQPLAAARALCPSLQARPRDSAAEHRLLHSLAAWAYRFSSQVSLSEPDALLIEIGASLRLFGGWPALERRLRRALARIDFAPAIAVAPIPAAAHVLATRHDGFFTDQREPMLTALGNIPLVHGRLDDKAISLLYNVGMRTLRDVFALPRAELTRRIGPAALAALDRMRGIAHEVLPLYQPPDRFDHRIDLDDRIEAWPPLLFPLRRLCSELSLFLTARDGGVQRCELVLDHEDHTATRVVVELLTPQREARMLYELVRSRLAGVALTPRVWGIALVARDLPTLRPQHQDLFEPKRAQALGWDELAERLRAHLGDGAVRRLAAAADHRPEKAWQFATGNRDNPRSGSSPSPSDRKVARRNPSPPDETAPPLSSPLPPAGEAAPQARVRVAHEVATTETLPRSGDATLTPALSRQREREQSVAASPAEAAPQTRAQTRQLRPLWLLTRAIPLRGPAPRILAGPERIESGWWDGGDARRDYYVVQTREGQRAWAFLAAGASDGWMLHGWFA